MPAELVTAADGDNTGNSFLFVRSDEQITGLEANILLPSSNEKGAGVYIAIWDSYPFESHGIELALKDDGNATIVIDYLDEEDVKLCGDQGGSARDDIEPPDCETKCYRCFPTC